MQSKKFDYPKLTAIALAIWFITGNLFAQGLLVDQASGTTNEVVTATSSLPDNQLAQSFTPSLSAVGFVEFSAIVPAFPGNDQVRFAVNLRQGAFNGPILGTTDPVVLVNHGIQFGPFYFPESVPVTPGQLYFFEPVLLSAGSLAIGTKFPSSYLGGDLWSNGLMDPNADLWFREGVVVPEPGAVCLLLFGASVFLLQRRNPRNQA